MIKFSSHASNSAGNLYSIDDGKTKLLLECGISIKKIKKALNFNLSSYSGCLASHSHGDHSFAAQDIMEAGVDLYCNQETVDAKKLSGHRLHVIQAMEQIKIGTWAIKPLSVPHDVENFAFLLANAKNKCLFLIDAAYSPYRFSGLTHIFIGINYQTEILRKNVRIGRLNPALGRRIMQSHMSLSTALDFFRVQDISKVQEIHVLHCSGANANKAQIKRAIQRQTGKLVVIGEEGC